jgi:hypothetical protein
MIKDEENKRRQAQAEKTHLVLESGPRTSTRAAIFPHNEDHKHQERKGLGIESALKWLKSDRLETPVLAPPPPPPLYLPTSKMLFYSTNRFIETYLSQGGFNSILVSISRQIHFSHSRLSQESILAHCLLQSLT